MHDIKSLEANLDFFKENLAKRGFDTKYLDQVLIQNRQRKEVTTKVESIQANVNKKSKEVGLKKRNGEDVSEIINEVAELKKSLSAIQGELEQIITDLNSALSVIPNILEEDVPEGLSEEENQEVRRWGTPKSFSFAVKDHVELGEKLEMLDFEIAGKITGARFVVYKNQLARLERALANFMLDYHLSYGREEIIPPFIVRDTALYGTGQLPKFKEDLFQIAGNDWYLIPTAEVPLTNLKRDQIFSEDEFPIRYVAYTPCFRSEAGSHGKDTRGLIRMHQFNKVEMVDICHPEKSAEALEEMTAKAEGILQALNLPYRVLKLCSGDIGFGARKTYDLEVWVPSQDKYREISSCSNCGDFQARRASIRFKGKSDKRPQFAHTLNGSGLAVGRTLVAILENYQNEDGSITIPEALRPFMGGLERIAKN